MTSEEVSPMPWTIESCKNRSDIWDVNGNLVASLTGNHAITNATAIVSAMRCASQISRTVLLFAGRNPSDAP